MMSESSGGRAGVGGVSDDAEDRVDAFVLSSIMSSVVESVPHARPGSCEFSLGGVLWKTVLCGLAYVAGFACGWLLLFGQDRDWVRSLLIQVSFPVLFSFCCCGGLRVGMGVRALVCGCWGCWCLRW